MDVRKALEPRINARLLQNLVNILQFNKIDGFNYALVETPARGAEHCDYTGQEIEKRPDIKISIRSDLTYQHREQYAYFIECKIIRKLGKSVPSYNEHGLQRFSDGKYAWATTCAGMVAYVRPDVACQTPAASLNAYFDKPDQKKTRRKKLNLTAGPIPVGKTGIAETVHDRSFKLCDGDWKMTDISPGSITVRHLWLTLNDEKKAK